MSDVSRLRWLCRRGMKELDVVLTRYLEQRFATASEAEQACFRELLQLQDPELYGLLLGREDAAEPDRRQLIETLRTMKRLG